MRVTALLIVMTTGVGLCAQTSSCLQNLVPYGDFTAVFPSWTVSGSVTTTFPTANVSPLGASRCIALSQASGTFNVVSPTTVSLGVGQYEFSVEVLRAAGWGVTFDLGLVGTGPRTSVGQAALPTLSGSAARRSRVAFRFTAAAAGSYALDLQMSTHPNEIVYLDDVTIHASQNPLFNIDAGYRRYGAANSYVIVANPNQVVAVLLAPAALAPLSVPGFGGFLMIGPPSALAVVVYPIAVGSGVYTASLTVPAGLPSVPLFWQALTVSPPYTLGCGTMIAF